MGPSGIVNILSRDEKSFGTGFFASPKGYILTCRHVLTQAGYRKIGQTIIFKYAEQTGLYEAKWIRSNDEADLAVLVANIEPAYYYPMCNQDVTGCNAECYGFPNMSQACVKATVLVEHFSDNENRIQLTKANTVTLGFSGGPLLYNGIAIGIVSSITKADIFGRMNEIAFAISSKLAMKLFPQNISKLELCVGYGENEKKCVNYVATMDAAKALGLCERCFAQKYADDVKALYKAQNYSIHEIEDFFVAELKYGASTYYEAVFVLVKAGDTMKQEELYRFQHQVRDVTVRYNITRTVIVTNAQPDRDCSEFIKTENMMVKTKDELLRGLFDYEPYRKDLMQHVYSNQLSDHYIEVYGSAELPKDRDGGTFDQDSYGDDYEGDCYLFAEKKELYKDYDFCEEDWERNDYDEQEYGEGSLRKNYELYLKDYVNAFLESKHRALLILGDYGSGKTSFCYTYTLALLELFLQGKSTFLPLLIKLRGYNKAVGIGQLLTDYFVNDLGITNFSMGAFRLLLKNIDAVLIFDGYDEVAKKVDFDIKYEVLRDICSLAESRTKVIVTCRPNYFQNASEFQEIFKDSHFQYEPGDNPLLEFIENSIADLNEEQIDAYIDSYQSGLAESGISKEKLIHTIANTHDLSDLAKRPFLLYMIMSTLPNILKETKGKKDAKINASKLYQVYTENWLRREDRKNKTLIKRADKELFCKELAFELYISNSMALSYRELPNTIKRHFQHVDREEDIDYFSHDIQSCSFLTSDRSGEFKFIHKSFMEYFVACQVVSKLDECFSRRGRKVKKGKGADEVLNSTRLSMEVCLFISDILSSWKRDLVNEAVEFLDCFNDTAIANLLSILSKTGRNMAAFFMLHPIRTVSLDHVDYGNAEFAGGEIRGMSFRDAQFYSTSLRGTIFVDCNFQGASFYKSTLEDVKFYNCQFISSKWRESKLVGCEFNPAYPDEYVEEYGHYADDQKSEVAFISQYEPFCFETSIWYRTEIEGCSFSDCSMVDNSMNDMKICNSTFQYVDFSGIYIRGYFVCSNNQMHEVLGEPYEFGW